MMSDRNAKADSSGDLHEIKALQAEIERLRHEIDVQCSSEYVERILKENERLRELTENDGKEIGSYREGTGLRGENRRLRAALEDALPCLAEHDPEVWDIAREALKDG
jgi:hypothetical protein